MIRKLLIPFITLCFCFSYGQNTIDIDAHVDVTTKSIAITQTITYKNTSNDTWNYIYLNDWNNSYASKSTPLAKRFEEEFSTKFHLAKDKQRGFTSIEYINTKEGNALDYEYSKAHPDVLKVILQEPVLPNEYYTIKLRYNLVLPDDSFTDYGFTKNKNFNLKYWYITPTAYTKQWEIYSNKNLDDLFVPKASITLNITHPKTHKAISELNTVGQDIYSKHEVTTHFYGKDRVDTFLALQQSNIYTVTQTNNFALTTDINEKNLSPIQKAFLIDKITNFLYNNIGKYPHEELLINSIDYNKNPLYGLNQLPDFLRPFPDDFQFELKILKTALKKYFENTLLLNPRKEYWLSEGLQIYFMMKYVEEYYPDMKLFGSLANVWGLRSFHAAELDFNYQYYLYFMEMARKNRDQPIATPKDKLIKFNANIAGKYKSGVGLYYLDDFTTDVDLADFIKSFYQKYNLKDVSTDDFKTHLKSKTQKDIDWFFNDYVTTLQKIDFKIKDIETQEDSVKVTIINKRNNTMPIPLFSLKNDSITSKHWIENTKEQTTLTLKKDNSTDFVLDYENVVPEFNQRDNYKTTNKKIFNKPLQLRLFKDIEDPNYNQVFFMPLVEFNNIYDGLTLGAKMYNKTVLRRPLNYRFSPQYATNSKSITGSASVFYTHNIEDNNLFNITYGVSAGYKSFGEDAFFTRIRPSLEFSFRDNTDLRKDTRQRILARYISIERKLGTNATVQIDEPDYGVFNLRYSNVTPGLINFSRLGADFQVASKFSKVSANYEFRKLSQSNRNINLRLFAGAFLQNNTNASSDYFSFALDRPTDYLFDYSYLGRSEASGLTSQQIIITEGGFKSQLDTPFANQWLTTANFSTSIWRYIQAYGDVGLIKNKYTDAKFIYDAGIRLNLVEDYFEIYFPFYSNLGWEIAQPNYDEKIRFMFTINPQILLGLFRRKWY